MSLISKLFSKFSVKNDSNINDDLHFLMAQVNVGLSRAAYAHLTRLIRPSQPITWEFSGFSQNGEDGIIEYVLRHVKHPNYYFVEIGSSDGSENNSSLLAFGKRYSGLMIEGETKKSKLCEQLFCKLSSPYIKCSNTFVTLGNTSYLLNQIAYSNPDMFSIDIDGNDFHILQAMLKTGFHPKLVVVEYNATFGDKLSVTIPYDEKFQWGSNNSWYYFGASIVAWRKLLESNGYQFITCERAGSNAFFIDKNQFHDFLPDDFTPTYFLDNQSCSIIQKGWKERISEIDIDKLIEI